MSDMDPRRSEVLILGGGVIGLACAYFLSRAGREVRIIERDTVGAGASFGNTGLITPSHAEPVIGPEVPKQALKWMTNKTAPLSVKLRFDLEFASWAWRFVRNCKEEKVAEVLRAKSTILRASRTLMGKLVEAEQMDCQWQESGLIAVCLEESGFQELQDFARRAGAVGIKTEILDGPSLREREPALRDEVVGGVLFPQDAVLRPDRFLAELRRLVEARGVAIEEGCEVKAINVEEGRVHSAYTNKGLFEAEHFVLAAGVWSTVLARQLDLDLPIEAGKGYSLTSNLHPDPCPKHGLLLHERRMAVSPWGNGFRIGGTMEFAGLDDSLNKARLNALIEGAELYLKDPLPPGPPTKWAGFRPMTPDDLPYIGPAPRHPNLMLATGHNMLGMSMCLSTGRLVTELMAGRKPHIDPAPFEPGRYSYNSEHRINRLRRWLWQRAG